MKTYKTVCLDLHFKRDDGTFGKAWCDQYSFTLGSDRRATIDTILNHYAALGWKLIQVVPVEWSGHAMYYNTKYYYYFEKEV